MARDLFAQPLPDPQTAQAAPPRDLFADQTANAPRTLSDLIIGHASPAPISDSDLNQGRAVAFANNIPFGEEALAAIGHPGDALHAALGDEVGGKAYYDELANAQTMYGKYRAARPWESFALSTLPGAVTAGGIIGGAVRTPATLAARAVQGGLVGSGVGAVYGYGSDPNQGSGDRLANAATGATVGGIFGLAAPAIATGAGNLYGAARELFTVDPTLTRLGVSKPAANVVGSAFASDNTMGNAVPQMRSAGRTAMLADAGPNMSQLLDTTMQRGGPGADIARRAVENRATGANAALQGQLDRSLGQAVPVESGQQAIRQGTASARQAAYDTAYDQPIDYSAQHGQQIETLLNRVPHSAIERANSLMRVEGNASRQIMARIGDDGTVSYQRMPDVRQVDYITRGLNDVAQSAEGQGAMGGTNQVGRAYGGLSSQIRAHLRAAVPEYATALDTAAHPIRLAQALEFGQTVLSPTVTRDAVNMEVQGMGAAERQASAHGIRQQIDDIMSNVRMAASDPNMDARQALAGLKAVSSDAARAKISAVIGDAQAQPLFTQLDQAERAFNLRANVARNSATASRLMTQDIVNQATDPGVTGTLLQGDVPGAMKRMISTATGHTPIHEDAAKQRLYQEIAGMLTGPRGTNAESFIANVVNANQSRAAAQARASQIIGSGRMLAPAAAVPAQRTRMLSVGP